MPAFYNLYSLGRFFLGRRVLPSCPSFRQNSGFLRLIWFRERLDSERAIPLFESRAASFPPFSRLIVPPRVKTVLSVFHAADRNASGHSGSTFRPGAVLGPAFFYVFFSFALRRSSPLPPPPIFTGKCTSVSFFRKYRSVLLCHGSAVRRASAFIVSLS